MKASSLASRSDYLLCPVCQVGELHSFGGENARCGSCGSILGAAMLLTLEQIVALADALGIHACECGHHEVRRVPLSVTRLGSTCSRRYLWFLVTTDVRGMFAAGMLEAYGTSPLRATSSSRAGRSSTCSSVMSRVG